VSADEITRVSVDQLTTWPGNPRRGNRAAIRESIQALGIYKPLIAQRSTGQVLVGNNTLAVVRELGIAEVDVIYKDIDDDTAERILLVDNKTSDSSGYYNDLLYDMLTELDGMTGTGWSQDELDAIIATAEQASGDVQLEFDFGVAGGEDVLVLDDVRTGAGWSELPQQTAVRAERQAAQTVSAVRGVREIMLVYTVAEHEEMILLLDGLKKRAGEQARYPQIIQFLVRKAAREAGLV
jgi:hypothetical protein